MFKFYNLKTKIHFLFKLDSLIDGNRACVGLASSETNRKQPQMSERHSADDSQSEWHLETFRGRLIVSKYRIV